MVFLLVLEFDKKNSRQIRSVITNKHEDIKDHKVKCVKGIDIKQSIIINRANQIFNSLSTNQIYTRMSTYSNIQSLALL